MRREDLSATLDAAKLMAEAEGAMAEFYQTCAQVPSKVPTPWVELEREERQHLDRVTRMAAIIAERPEQFEPLRSFKPVAIRTFISYVVSATDRLRRNELPGSDFVRLLSTARDIEQSYIESKYGEIVQSRDPEYQQLLGEILDGTRSHQARLETLLASARKA